ncbi:MAG: 3-oxoacyl-ACP reductase [Dehalococcoidia bacterium]|nr:3-oxoacyl-ACP reductase [Dehalococcoidia bacterium]|tara:strand:+ start:1217 stop:1984 length:768 start_codon:yes stop_codon:yes gene_type:complete
MSPKELCLITGGGSGIGRATAIKFASNNIKTIIVGRREEALLETIDLAGKYGDNITLFQCDISLDSEIKRLREDVEANFGSVSILINNAGASSQVRSIAHIPTDQWDNVLNVNLRSVYRICQEFLKDMLNKKSGTIITVSSMAALNPGLLGGSAYSAAKAAVTNLMGDINAEFSNMGIRATAIMPAEVDTPILDNRALIPDKDARLTMMQPEDLAEMIFTVASLDNRTTVETIVMKPTIKRDLSEDLKAAMNKTE